MVLEIFISNLIANFSYIGIFIASFLVSASLVFPLPGYLVILGVVILDLDPILSSVIMGCGSMGGELIAYNIGILSDKVARRTLKKWKRMSNFLEDYFKKYGFLTIFITAFLIFPFDLVSIIAGINRYDIKKYLIAGFLGKTLKTWLFIVLTIKGISYIQFLL